ncbi:MAG: HlyD family efflux transporter periplasmic adaptor subunit [Fusobacteriaceae bacterium]
MNKKIMIGAIILAVIFAGYSTLGKMLALKEVKVSRIEMGNISSSTLYAGIVGTGDVVPVYIEAPALVESLLTSVGQEVKVGDKLLTFSSKSVIENDRELKINELDIKDIKLRIADLDGGSLKLELDNRKLEMKNLEEKIRGDERRLPVIAAETRSLKEKSSAYKILLAADGVSSTEANRAKNDADKKEVELEDLKTELSLNRQKFELSAVSFESLTRELAIQSAKLKSSLEKLNLMNEILARRAEQLKKPLEAPIAGVITALDVTEGSNVFGGERLLSISPNGISIVKVEVPIYAANSIALNQKALVKSRDSRGDSVYEGVVSRVSNLARESKLGGKKDNVIEIEIKIPAGNSLKPGFRADVEINSKTVQNVMTLNSFSVIEERENSYVYIVKDGKAIKTEVKVGSKTNKSYEIQNLPLGTEVVINPFRVKNGERVKVVI